MGWWEFEGRLCACFLLLAVLVIVSLQADWGHIGDLFRRGDANKFLELRIFCNTERGEKCDVTPPFFALRRRTFTVAPSVGLAKCDLNIGADYVYSAVFCKLFNESAFAETSLMEDVNERAAGREGLCGGVNEVAEEELAKVFGDSDFTRFAVFRDPLRRFAVNYYNLCMRSTNQTAALNCYNCDFSLRCVLTRIRERSQQFALGELSEDDLLEEDFAFLPQSWFCNLKHELHSFELMRYPEQAWIWLRLGPFLEAHHLDGALLAELKDDVNGTKPEVPFKVHMVEESIRGRYPLIQTFVLTYYHDYKIFNYELPEVNWKGEHKQVDGKEVPIIRHSAELVDYRP